MTSLFPRETHPEALFQKILSQPQAKARLYETFCAELEDYTDTEGLVSRTMPYGLLRAYENQDLSAFLVGLCGNTMFDLLRAAFLIPNRFGGKEGDNPLLLTSEDGAVMPQVREAVSPRTLRKFSELRQDHTCVPRSALYLAEGSQLRHQYDREGQPKEVRIPARQGVLALYALPDTAQLGLSEAQAYSVVFDAFNAIQDSCPTALVFYGQDTGYKRQRPYDELGVLLPLKEFEHRLLHHLEQIDGIALACRESMPGATLCPSKRSKHHAEKCPAPDQGAGHFSCGVSEPPVRHDAGKDQAQGQRQHDEQSRGHPGGRGRQVHDTQIIHRPVEIQPWHHDDDGGDGNGDARVTHPALPGRGQ